MFLMMISELKAAWKPNENLVVSVVSGVLSMTTFLLTKSIDAQAGEVPPLIPTREYVIA
jgi:hypothetical protein